MESITCIIISVIINDGFMKMSQSFHINLCLDKKKIKNKFVCKRKKNCAEVSLQSNGTKEASPNVEYTKEASPNVECTKEASPNVECTKERSPKVEFHRLTIAYIRDENKKYSFFFETQFHIRGYDKSSILLYTRSMVMFKISVLFQL